jgi:hypothetical protein
MEKRNDTRLVVRSRGRKQDENEETRTKQEPVLSEFEIGVHRSCTRATFVGGNKEQEYCTRHMLTENENSETYMFFFSGGKQTLRSRFLFTTTFLLTIRYIEASVCDTHHSFILNQHDGLSPAERAVLQLPALSLHPGQSLQ